MPCLKTSLESDAPMARGPMEAIRAPQSRSSILLCSALSWMKWEVEREKWQKLKKGGGREKRVKGSEGKGFWSIVVAPMSMISIVQLPYVSYHSIP